MLDSYEDDYRPGYNPAFLARVREQAKRRRQAERAEKAHLANETRAHRNIRGMPQTASDIINEIAVKHDIPAEVIMGPLRSRSITPARHELFYELKARLKWTSWPIVAAWVGGRDHTSAMHGAAKHALLCGLPPVTSYDVIRQRERHYEYTMRRKAK